MNAAGLGGCAALVLLLALAGCGGDTGGEERAHAGATEARTAASGAGTTETEAGQAAATEPEVAWAGRVIDWAISVGSAVEYVAANAADLPKGREPPGATRGAVREALRALAECEPYTTDEVGKPPSERLEPVRSALDRACDRYAAGAVAALDLLREPRQDETLAGEWEATWHEGGELMRSISESLRDFQPSNTRTLPERSGRYYESRVDTRFGEVASKLVETDVEVRCWSERDWPVLMRDMKRFTRGRIGDGTIGFAGHGDHRVNLAPEICEGLVALAYDRARPQHGKRLALVSISVETLMHEAQHVRGVWNEPGAECYGMQMLRDAARELGASRVYAAKLAEVYWADLYALLPKAYRSPECRDGGALDADPDSDVWP